jgi:hypothetical protein
VPFATDGDEMNGASVANRHRSPPSLAVSA